MTQEAKLTQLEEKGEALQRIPLKPQDVVHQLTCARWRCPLNLNGQRCQSPGVWYTCRRQIEP